MHEYSLAQALLCQVKQIARREEAEVRSLNVTIGEFSGVDAELMKLAFEDLAQQSELASAELVIDQVALEARCERCFNEFPVKRFRFVCSKCESGDVKVIRGEEMMLERVVLEA